MRFIKEVLRFIYPESIYCICCGSIIDASRSYSLCDNCIEKIKWIGERTCEKCGKILQQDYSHEFCEDCRNAVHYFDKGYTCCQYGLYERALIMDLEYGDKSYLGNILGDIMADRIIMEEKTWDLILPVPIHKERMRSREFNQACVRACRVGKRLEVKVDEGILVRVKKTLPMKGLGVPERKVNLNQAFKVREKAGSSLKGKNILLIDDVYTTGSTSDACAKVLKEAGAREVDVLTFAAGANMPGTK